MSQWLHRVSQQPLDQAELDAAIGHFDALAEHFASQIAVKGHVLIGVSAEIPDLSIKVHMHWSEINAIYQFIEVRRHITLGHVRKHYVESYERVLSASQIEKYTEADPAVIRWDEQLIGIDFVKAKWEAVSKGLERLHQQLRIIAEMRRAGLETATI